MGLVVFLVALSWPLAANAVAIVTAEGRAALFGLVASLFAIWIRRAAHGEPVDLSD
jgi:hypothetical protein